MSQPLKPDTICRIVNATADVNNKLVRTISLDTTIGQWWCEALEHIPCWSSGHVGGMYLLVHRLATPGEELSIPPENLKPLYDGDADDEMVSLMRKKDEEVSHA